MKNIFILGGAQTDFERNWSKEGKNEIALLSEVFNDSVNTCKITQEIFDDLKEKDKVGCFVGNFASDLYVEQGHVGALMTLVDPTFEGMPIIRCEAACASGSAAIDVACAKIQAGQIDLAVVVGWELMKTVDSSTGSKFIGHAAYVETEAKGIEHPFPKLFSKLADYTLDKYNFDESRYFNCLAKISTKNFENASKNPNAQTKKWFFDFEHAKTRGVCFNEYIGNKLAISDCSQITDGAAIVFLASENYLNNFGINQNNTPRILGYSNKTAPILLSEKMKNLDANEYLLPWTRKTIDSAYKMANVSVDDIDFFETHDCFSSSEFAAISCFGLCKPGEELENIESGRFEFDGEKPINPSGGLIGGGHPLGATGVRMMLDLYKQLTKKADGHQLPNAKIGAMLNIGGTATTNYAFVVGF